MPDLGIGEAIAGLGGADILSGIGSLFGLGDAAGAGAAGLGEAAAAGLGPSTLGTAADFLGTGSFDALAGSALAGTGADVASTAGSFLAAPGAALGAGGAGIGGAAADAALSNAATTGLASGTESILPAGAGTSAFDSAIPGAASAIGAGAGVPNANPFANAPSTATGVATSSPGATSAVPGLQSTVGAGGAAGPGTLSAPAGGSTTGAADLTSAASGGSGVAGAAGGAAKTTPTFFDNLVAGAEKNAIPAAIAAGGLGYNLLKGGGSAATSTPSGGALNTQAANLAQSSPALMQYLTSGTLPAGMKAGLDKATADAKTAAISNAAKSGMPTDPSQNSSLQQELAAIDQQAQITTAQLGQQLLQSGLSEAQLSASDYSTLLQADQTQQKQISDSIANFAKALGGMGGGVSLKLA
jgi:hypothetical protein